ncbi:response regulator [Echinicola marina]|uniref:response regulator n=1 Tax=Echinicola marina TaxID=2859768 RepID=UPI001CF69823|nr:response regulator [Echinicola marina]UCS94973.1 response regulator [Echinicola marina]
MKHLILHLGQLSSELDSASFSSCNLENLRKENSLNPIEESLKRIDEKDLFPYRVSSYLTTEKYESIIIFKEGLGWDQVIRLSVYLRLLPDDNWISKTPIIICSDNVPNPIYDKDLANLKDIQNFLNIPGVFYKSFFALFGKGENDEGNTDYGINKFLKTINKDFDTKAIIITSENLANDRHSITNHWGAVKLALNAGYGLDEIDYTFPPTLYFNYLIKKYSIKTEPNTIKTNFNSLLKRNKVLLIDDQSDKGWHASLAKMFEPGEVDVADDFEMVNQFGNLKDVSSYDLIFLDLRLPKIQKKEIEYDNGINLLKRIKDSYPQVPIIVFTASNKSWTRETVRNFGADGMYVKESPEYAGDQTYSKENFINFEKSVRETLEKYKVLRPYWEAIQKILKDQTFLSIPEKGSSNFKSRIEERLMMFYGLLKRGFEQTEYNERQFHFSDYELAFMTLWSVLNEISEANFIKSQPNITIQDSAGNLLSNHPGGQPITYNQNHFKWEIIGQSDTYVEYAYSTFIDTNTRHHVTNTSGRYYKLNHERKSCFLFENNQFHIVSPIKTNTNYENTLFLQIAFLIERKANLSISSNKSNFQHNLVRLNEARNHLYLTHGSDISSGFYNQTEKAKRVNHSIKPNGDIKELFELISFLLTGKENGVDIN